METEYSLLPEDLLAFARYYRSLRSVQPSFSWIAKFGFLAILIAGVGSLVLAHNVFDLSDHLIGIGIPYVTIVLALTQCWWYTFWYRSFYKAQCEDPRNAYWVRDVRVVISSEKLLTLSRQAASTYDWSVVWHIGVTHKHVFLFITTSSAIVIPRRAFRDPGQCEEFIALAREYRQGGRKIEQKPTGIIAGLPAQSHAFTRPDVS